MKKSCRFGAVAVLSVAAVCFDVDPTWSGAFAIDPSGSRRLEQQETEQTRHSIFTGAQALRGEAVYDAHCASCHGSKLEGTPASALTGERFVTKWGDGKHTVDDLYYITRTQMPYGDAGKLTKQQYIDVVAFMLNKNGYRPGDQELPADPAVLRKLTIKPNDSSKDTTTNKGERE
jgi:cytochrome c